MAGSLNHIIDDDGTFTMDGIENLRDAHEALEECFHIIRYLAESKADISEACRKLRYPDPWEDEPDKPGMQP
jgi:hypothetical protein